MAEDSINENPIVKVLRQDREKEDAQAINTLKDYHTTITYLGSWRPGLFPNHPRKIFPTASQRIFLAFYCQFNPAFSLLAVLFGQYPFRFFCT